MSSPPRLCSYAAVVVWAAWTVTVAVGHYDESMTCGSGGDGRDGRYFHRRVPDAPCDLSRNGWCDDPGKNYPWISVRRFIYENQGLMKRMYGDQRHINVLHNELQDNMFEEMASQNIYNYQPNLAEPPPSSASRKSKKIKRTGRDGARAMEVTMEPLINKNDPISKTAQKKSSISSSKTYTRVINKGNSQAIRQKVAVRRPPKAPPSERQRVPVKVKQKTRLKTGASATKSTPATTTKETTATSASPNTPQTSPATTVNTKDESTESTRTTRQMQDQSTTSEFIKEESGLETTIRNKQHNSESTSSSNQSPTTEEDTITVQETIEPTTNDPTTTSGVESTVDFDSYTTVEDDTESATLLQATFREDAGPDIFDGTYESTYNSFDLYEKPIVDLYEQPIGGPLRHSDTLTTSPGKTQATYSSYTSISSDAAPPSSLTANTPSLAEVTKEYESSTARSEFPLDFGDDFLSASHDDGDLETIMFEEELAADTEEPRPLSIKERIAQDYKSSTEGSDLTTISLAERIEQAVDVRVTGSSYHRDDIDLAMEEMIADDASLKPEHRIEVVEFEEEEVVENEENTSTKPPNPAHIRPMKGINACPVKGEVQQAYWANNTRGEVLALLNMYPFEQYIHMEKCVHENRQMYCRKGCRCEQQYRLHRLLAFDPTNECRGIFSDWFSFPSCCVCKCYNLHHNIFEGSSRRPRVQSDPDDEYFDEEYYYDDEEEEDIYYDVEDDDDVDEPEYIIEDFNLEQFEQLEEDEKTKRKNRAYKGSVPPSKIQPQRAPRPLGRPKSHVSPPGPAPIPPSPNLLPPPTSSSNKRRGRIVTNNRRTGDVATPANYNDAAWMSENGRALPLFRIKRNEPENEEDEENNEKN